MADPSTAGEVEALRPPRGYSWPPFQPGHELSTSHGAFSARKVNPIAQELERFYVDQIETGTSIAYLSDPAFMSALASLCDTEARVLRLRWWLDGQAEETGRPGELEEDGSVRPAAVLLLRLETKAQRDRERLGLDPLGRSKLGRDMAATQADLAAVSRAGGEAFAARPVEATAAEHPPGDVDSEERGDDGN